MTILDEILQEKKKEIRTLKKRTFNERPTKKVPTFKEQIEKANTLSIIAEIKRSSPSKGEIDMGVDPIQQAKNYEKHGAAAISVLTDEPFFNGTMEDLKAVRQAVNIPILCKDFIIDPIQIDQAKAAGANIILLIVAALGDDDLKNLYMYAKEQQLEVLVEVHDEEEMERALELNPEIIGINNRNLKTFEVNLDVTEKLASFITNPATILISESGMKTLKDANRASHAGARAILVGETLMESSNLKATFHELQVPLAMEGSK